MSRRLAPVVAALSVLTPALGSAGESTVYRDPSAYCRAIGTIDRPDSRYDGPAMPDWIARSLMRALHAPPDAPLAAFRRSVWRCSEGRVLACLYGANIPCAEKADGNRLPPAGAERFCRQRPGADVVPSVAFSRPTIFLWHCKGIAPAIVRQVLTVDRDGYPAPFWHAVAP